MDKSIENAEANVRFLNEVQPYLIFAATLHVDPGSPLYDELQAGSFVENTLGQNLVEEIMMLKGLELKNTCFFGLHTSNVIPVYGMLPEDKESMLRALQEGMASIAPRILDSRPRKGFEGAAVLD